MTLLPETARRIDTRVADAQVQGHAPSLILGLVRNGSLAHVAAAGTTPEPGPDLQYRIGSISKTLTAVLVMRLRDAGRLGLDDPLDAHLPGTPVGRATLRQLLGHASGLQREPDGDWWERSAGTDLANLLTGLTADKLAHPPHRVYHYSNLAYGLLGGVLERLTGEPWWELVRTELLTPLSMTRTSYQAREPFARGYVVHPWYDTLREEPRTDAGALAPAGQLWSTITDLARWAAFLADPDPAILAPGTFDEMCRPVIIDPDTWHGGHGLGIELTRSGDRVYAGHGGSMPGYVATVDVHRPSRTAVVGYANAYGLRTGHLGTLGVELLDLVLDTDPAPAAPPWRPATGDVPPEAADLAGQWWWMGRSHEITWDAAADELVVHPPGGRAPWRFGRAGTDRWRGRSGMNDGEDLVVRRDDTGRADTLDIATFVFTRHPDRID